MSVEARVVRAIYPRLVPVHKPSTIAVLLPSNIARMLTKYPRYREFKVMLLEKTIITFHLNSNTGLCALSAEVRVTSVNRAMVLTQELAELIVRCLDLLGIRHVTIKLEDESPLEIRRILKG